MTAAPPAAPPVRAPDPGRRPAHAPAHRRRRGRRRLRAVLAGVGALLLGMLASLLVAPGAQAPTRAPAAAAPSVRPSQAPVDAGHVYRVAPGGKGDSDFPSLEKALGALRAGDTLLVEDGRYTERVKVRVSPGSPSSRVTVRAADGARPVVQGLLWVRGADYWDFSGVDVTWGTRNRQSEHLVKLDGGREWSLTDAEISYARSFAAILVTGGATRFRLADLYVHDTRPSNSDNQDHLIYVNTYAEGAVIERSLLVGSPNGRAVKVGPPTPDGPPVGGLEIRYNTMVDNRGPSNVQLSYSARDVLVHHNLLVGAAPGSASVTAYRLEGGGSVVRDNAYDDATGAVAVADGLSDGGGNRRLAPRFADPARGDFRPLSADAARYGRYAPG